MTMDLFPLQVMLTFVVGTVWIAGTALHAERYGSTLGGFVGGLPSTIVIALLFIGITQSTEVASEATTIIPLTMGMNGLFVVTYVSLVQRGLWLAVGAAILFWSSLATVVLLIGTVSLVVSLISWAILLLICYLILEKKATIQSQSRFCPRSPFRLLFIRGCAGGTIVTSAVLLAKVGGPLLGGLCAAFPAMFLSTLLMMYRSGGPEFSRSGARSLLWSGMVNVVLYALSARFLFQLYGLWVGTILALLVPALFWAPWYFWMWIRDQERVRRNHDESTDSPIRY
jgi:hypothetical protein